MDSRAPRLDAAHWLDTWDRARALPALLRPCAWLAPLLADELDEGQRIAESMAIGRRDTRLVELHAALFGPRLEATAHCPACGEHVEFDIDAQDIVDEARSTESSASSVEWAQGPYRGRARLPDSRDLLAISSCHDEETARSLLFERCVQVDRNDDSIEIASLPDDVASAVSTALADADAQAISEIDLACPVCAHRWGEPFAIDAFLGAALDRWAEHTLDDIHRIATAYGWSEGRILALTASRRASYLARIDV